jgi:hypothetical protein
MHISRVTTWPSDFLTVTTWPSPFDQRTFMFGSFSAVAPGPDLALGEALLEFTKSNKPIPMVHHGYAMPMGDEIDGEFMFGACPEQYVLPPLGEVAMYLHDAELG